MDACTEITDEWLCLIDRNIEAGFTNRLRPVFSDCCRYLSVVGLQYVALLAVVTMPRSLGRLQQIVGGSRFAPNMELC
jgi:hypothetical protein